MLFWQLVQYLHLYGLSTLCDFVASVYVDKPLQCYILFCFLDKLFD